jgi:6-phosphogluconolactonase
MYIATYPDSDTLSHQAAQLIVRLAAESVVTHGRFTVALAGGSTPRKLYGLLANEPYRSQIDWALVEVFWSDERCVPVDDPESNFRMAQEAFLSKVPIAENQVHRMHADWPDRDAAAQAYVIDMRRIFGTDGIPSFDLIQLGLGPEGHTASLFPHQAALHEQERLVMPVRTPKPPPDRLTFTPPLLNAARHVLFLVAGSDKANAVHEVIEGEYNPDEYPAQIVHPPHGEVTWMLDTAAASKLSR